VVGHHAHRNSDFGIRVSSFSRMPARFKDDGGARSPSAPNVLNLETSRNAREGEAGPAKPETEFQKRVLCCFDRSGFYIKSLSAPKAANWQPSLPPSRWRKQKCHSSQTRFISNGGKDAFFRYADCPFAHIPGRDRWILAFGCHRKGRLLMICFANSRAPSS
jgi:hypothetical protein